MARLEEGAMEPSFRDIENGFVMNWYIPEREQGYWKTVPFIVGMDSAMGVGRDATTLVAIDPVSLKTLFTWGSNEANITRVTEMVFQLMLKYPKMVLVPEAKASGISIIHGLCCLLEEKNISPFTRIYNEIVQNKDDKTYD
ncbi:terminase large subunit, partial [Lasius niger]